MSIATIITKYNNFTDKNLDGRNWFVCDHCHKIMAFGTPEAGWAVSGFDNHGEAVDFCDIECAVKAGYELCGDCNMLYLPSEMSDMKCSDGYPMCKSCAAKNKKDMEENKMENKNQIDIIGNHILELANRFNHVILFDDNYETYDEQNADAHFYDDLLDDCMMLSRKLGYTIKFEECECENQYYWNEYVRFDITNTVTGETKTFNCDCPTRKYKVTITSVIECEARNKDEAERIAREKMNLDWCSDYETECYVEERR